MGTSPTLLVATWGAGLFAVRSGAVEREIAEGVVAGLTSDGGGRALAIAGGKALVRRSADGRWTTLGTSSCTLSSCAVLDDDVFVGTDDARVLRLEGREFVPLDAFGRVAGREAWYAGTAVIEGRVVGPPLGVRSMCATRNAALLVNVHVGGIPRSTDRGATWKPTIDIEADVHEVCAHATRSELAAAATARGLAISKDGGETWTIEHEGLHATHCSAVAFVGDDILVSASTDPFAKDGAVYRRSIAGGPLRRVSGLPEWLDGAPDTGNIAARGECVAVADRGGHVYLSRNNGATWEQMAEGLAGASGLLVAT